MDYWNAKNSETLKKGFGMQRMVLSSKTSVIAYNRPHTSLSMVINRAREIARGTAFAQKFELSGTRYVLAKDLTYDLFVSLYDVNSKTGVFVRPTYPLDSGEIKKLNGMIGKLKKPNLEIRTMGMQNGDITLTRVVDELHNAIKADMIEMDFFGNTARHVALDLKTGMSYDVLLLDRIYRAEELLTLEKRNEFDAKVSKIKFV